MGKIRNLDLEVIQYGLDDFQAAVGASVTWSLEYGLTMHLWRENDGWIIACCGTNPDRLLKSATIGRRYRLKAIELCGSLSIPANVLYLIDPVFVPTRKPR